MQRLSDATPRSGIVAHDPNSHEVIIANGVADFLLKSSKDVPGACMFVWDEMVDRGVASHPFAISPVVENGYQGIYDFIRDELDREPIVDAFASKWFHVGPASESFVDISLVECFPGDIHIADVEFSDVGKPVKRTDPSSEYRKYHGLHVFDEFMENLTSVARSRGAERLSLMVAHAPLYRVFERHGFRVSSTHMAQMAFQMAGTGFPMLMDI